MDNQVASVSSLLQTVPQCVLGCMRHFELWFSQGICPVVGLLDHINACMQNLENMVQRKLFAGQEVRLGHKKRTCGHGVGRGAWRDQREYH